MCCKNCQKEMTTAEQATYRSVCEDCYARHSSAWRTHGLPRSESVLRSTWPLRQKNRKR